MSQAFGRGRLGPAYTGIIVIKNFNGGFGGGEDILGGCVSDEMLKAEDGFYAFICGVDFCFRRAAGRDFLTAQNPVDWAIEEDDKAGDGPGFEEGGF